MSDLIGLSLLGLALIIQLVYIILLIRFIFSGRKKTIESDLPSISIIVTSRNYVDHLRELLPSLLNQKYPNFELVVVDDCSTDGTDWLLAELKMRHGNLKTSRILQETDFPNALAITIGVRAATKEWLIFLNPLCRVPDEEWLANYADKLKPGKEVAIGYLHYNLSEGNFKDTIRFENFYNYLIAGAAKYLGWSMPLSEYNIAYRREKFLELRGFAAVLDSPFCENELYLNKISTRKNSLIHFSKGTTISYIGETDWADVLNYKKKQLLLRHKLNYGQRFFLSFNTLSRLLLNIILVFMMIVSPYRLWVLGIWSFVYINETIWLAVATKKVGEKNFMPTLLFYNTILPLINSYFVINQLFSGQKRKWK